MSDPTADYIKVFVVPASEWDNLDDEGKDAVHARNQRAVRQGLLSQGMRAPAETDVSFSGEERVRPGAGGRSTVNAESVRLTYTVPVTTAAVATDYENVHMVVSPAPGTPTAQAQAEWEAGAEQRVRDSHAVKAGRATVAE